MGGNGFIDSELLFSDTVHQFLQVLTMTLILLLSFSLLLSSMYLLLMFLKTFLSRIYIVTETAWNSESRMELSYMFTQLVESFCWKFKFLTKKKIRISSLTCCIFCGLLYSAIFCFKYYLLNIFSLSFSDLTCFSIALKLFQ